MGLRHSSQWTVPTASPSQEVVDGEALGYRNPASGFKDLAASNTPDAPATEEVKDSLATDDVFAPPEFGPGRTTHFRVVQSRGMKGTPWYLRRIIASLGFRHRMQAMYLPHHASVAGELLKVKELIRVDNVRRLDLTPEHKALPAHEALWVNSRGNVMSWGILGRTTPRGYKIVGNRLKSQGFDRNAVLGERRLP